MPQYILYSPKYSGIKWPRVFSHLLLLWLCLVLLNSHADGCWEYRNSSSDTERFMQIITSKENQYFELDNGLKHSVLRQREMNSGQSRQNLRFKMDFVFPFSIKKLNSIIFYSSLFSSKTSKKANQETYLARHSFLENVHFIVHLQFIWMWELQTAYTPLTNLLHAW